MDLSHYSPEDQLFIQRFQRLKGVRDTEGGSALVEHLQEILRGYECSVSTQLDQPWYTLGQIKMLRDVIEILTTPFDPEAVAAQFAAPPQEKR